ncbi:MAG: helix-turn-helix domain-containing protein [Candidatus Gracilibacteria bacterium]|nr:helix-turn-helix domain-containing protein [Candidatus Gracilibacteria bacterium]
MSEQILNKIGLNGEEAKIYLFLISNPKKTIMDLSKELGINRPKLYKIIPSMLEQGLISKILIGKRIYFIAENPKIFNTYLDNIKKDFEDYIPELESQFSNNFSKPIFKHLSGKTGIRNIFLDIGNTLNKGDIFYRYSSRNNVSKTSIDKSEYDKYKKLRDEKRLERMVITNDYLNNLKENKLDKEVVIVPKNFDIFEDNITKIIYANKVAIIDYNTEESFIIESYIFANFEKKLFKLLFNFLKKIK